MSTLHASSSGNDAEARCASLRRREFSRLDRDGDVYLDYTGAGLYPESLLSRHSQLLREAVFGNPHSGSPSSVRSTALLERCRHRVLSFFNASPDEYAVIFTANASQALKLVGESYPFGEGDRLLLTFDNHNSVLGIREFARARGASRRSTSRSCRPTCGWTSRRSFARWTPARRRAPSASRIPPSPTSRASSTRSSGSSLPQARGWDVLLDAAAFVPTNRLDLGRWHPDFVVMSFYKMFGYPTGVGALLARHSALRRLRRPWFAGGTITVASVQADRHYLAPGGTGFEDGTANFLAATGRRTWTRLHRVGRDRQRSTVTSRR